MPLSHSNNFDFLRFVAATLVVWSHAFPLTGREEMLSTFLANDTSGRLGVAIFFIISGYLVTGSLMNTRGIMRYFIKRFLRIYPAFFVSVLFCFFIVAPLASTQTVGEFFTTPYNYHYLRNLSFYHLFIGLPSVLETVPLKTAINGSYWTLPIEWSMYSIIAILLLVKLLRLPLLILAVAACFLFFTVVPSYAGDPSYRLYLYARYAGLFLMASCFYLAKDKIPYRFSWFLAACAVIVAVQYLPALTAAPAFCPHRYFCGKEIWYSNLITTLLLPYVILYIGQQATPVLRDFARYGDFSYGIFLYGFPVQQLVVLYLGADMPVLYHFLITLLYALMLAYLSWHYIEKPALRLKARVAR